MKRQTTLVGLAGLVVLAAGVLGSILVLGVPGRVASQEAGGPGGIAQPSQPPSTQIITTGPTAVTPLTATITPTPLETVVPGAPASPPAATTSEASGCPDITPHMTMVMEGPVEAKPGEQLTYHLSYELVDEPQAGLRIDWTQGVVPGLAGTGGVTLVSSRQSEGSGRLLAGRSPASEGTRDELQWAIERGRGSLEFTLLVPASASFRAFKVGARVGGTCTPQSNVVTTTILLD